MSQNKAILLDIDRAARLVIDFGEGMDKDAFLNDLKTQSAVLLPIDGDRGGSKAAD